MQYCLIESVICLTCVCVVIVVSYDRKIIRLDDNSSIVHGNRSPIRKDGGHREASSYKLIDHLWKTEIDVRTKIGSILSGCRVSKTHVKITLVIFVDCCDVCGLFELLVIADVNREGESLCRGY